MTKSNKDFCSRFKEMNLESEIKHLLMKKGISEIGDIQIKCIPKGQKHVDINIVINEKLKSKINEYSIPEKIIIDYLKTVDSSSQRDISTHIDMAKSTVSKTLSSLLKKEAVRKSEFFDEFGDFRKKGKSVSHYIIDDEDE